MLNKITVSILFLLFAFMGCIKKKNANNNDIVRNPYCNWHFKNQDYSSVFVGVDGSSAPTYMFTVKDTTYPINELNYFTSSVQVGTYPIGQIGISPNSMILNYSKTVDTIMGVYADTGVIHITANNNSYINTDFIAVFGSDSMTGDCHDMKLY